VFLNLFTDIHVSLLQVFSGVFIQLSSKEDRAHLRGWNVMIAVAQELCADCLFTSFVQWWVNVLHSAAVQQLSGLAASQSQLIVLYKSQWQHLICVCVKRSSKRSASKQPSGVSSSERSKTDASSSSRDELMNGLTVCEICGAVVKCLSTISLLICVSKYLNFLSLTISLLIGLFSDIVMFRINLLIVWIILSVIPFRCQRQL